jgi:hypothetical protein
LEQQHGRGHMGWPRGPSVVCLFVMMVRMHDSAISTDVNLNKKN